MGITAGSREVPGRNACDRRHTYRIIIIIIIHLLTAIWLSSGDSGYFTSIGNMKLVTTRFKSGGLHEKHVVATWNLGNHLGIYNHFSIYPVHYIHIFNSQVRDFLIITRRKLVTYFRRNMRPPSSW